MVIFYNGCLYWLDNQDPLFRMVDGLPAPNLGVYDGPTYPGSPWSVSI
jgi:hypothetical protein